MLKKSLLIWLMMIPLAIINGIFRELYLDSALPEGYALPASGILFCTGMSMLVFYLLPILGRGSKKIYLQMGLLWGLLTISFETVLGYLMGYSWQEIWQAYDITSGNLWLLIVWFITNLPLTVAKMRHLIVS